MTKLFDSHAHLTDSRFDGDINQILENMKAAGVDRCICVGADIESSLSSLEFANKHEGIWAACGVHPHSASEFNDEQLTGLKTMLVKKKAVALGEIGLDYYYDFSDRKSQRRAFETQLDLAARMDIPTILHVREAHGDTISILKNQKKLPPMVVHCFAGSKESMEIYVSMGAYISFTGSVTFKNAEKLRTVAANVPKDRLMIETDCPYLAPVPKRGRRNEPAYVEHVARLLADVRGVSYEELAYSTYENANRFFRLT